ncbi:MAG: ABC transporter permease [Candidatus Omnitrophica bacterium]|nr:ABC transporter permease [Candidatus Omnitrophota bacterium]MCE7907423.1 ABC transporter permease [Candidatus Omnitrophica bacterium COP1]MCK6495434.1 ABC transporter permease [bacterium]MCL4735966.1 ABC transporter permease [Candidatus Omnitrophota bacterium]NUP91734.1 ABC transporter permease [Candidatus Omnitrophota bacterium]
MTVDMPGPMTAPGSHFVGYTGTAFSHALLLLWRRKHLLVLLVITLLPGLLPLLLWFFSGKASHSGPKSFFNDMAFHVYLENLVPLVSVFFGCSLVSEELDNRTIHHILTRPIPRSAWLLGRFMAFTTASFLSFAAGLGFLFGACALTGNIQAVSSNLMILIHYIGITAFALLPYTALCTFWGASMKKPMVLSLVVIIGWQNLALLMPGVVDFLTIEKYIQELLPEGTVGNTQQSLALTILEAQKQEYLVGTGWSIAALLFITGLFMLLAIWMVRRREYASARFQQ